MNRNHFFNVMSTSVLASLVVMAGCAEDIPNSSQTNVQAIQKSLDVQLGADPIDLRGFDVTSAGASATLLGLGFDVKIDWDGGFSFGPSAGSNAELTYSVKPTLSRGGKSLDSQATQVTRMGSDLWLNGTNVKKRFSHRPEGLAVSYVLNSRPEGSDPISLEYSSAGYQHTLKDGKVLVSKGKDYVFQWNTFKAWDANNKELPIKLAANDGRFQMSVDDSGAVYPVTIDPIATSPFWLQVGDLAGARFGFQVQTADVTGDGLADVLVAQQRYGGPELEEGRILLFKGTVTGVSSTAAWTYEGNQEGAYLGSALSVLGDVNGDGIDDFATSAAFWDGVAGVDVGRVVIFVGAATPATTPFWEVEGSIAGEPIGDQISSQGDLNCDGRLDLAITAAYDNGGDGTVRVYLNSTTGLPTTASTIFSGAVGSAENFGSGVIMANINNDFDGSNPCDDLIISGPSYDLPTTNQGRLHVYLGSTTGLGAPQFLSSGSNNSNMGISLAKAGDINGDGFTDIVAGAPFYSGTVNQEGGAFIFYGSAAGLNTPPTIVSGGGSNSLTGAAVAAGDVNNDGYSDVIVGGEDFTSPEASEGRVLVFQGRASGISTTAVSAYESNTVNAFLGYNVASGTDLNGDGIDDVLAGARAYSELGGPLVGAVFAFAGRVDCEIAGVFYDPNTPNPTNACEICDVAVSRTAWTSTANGTACTDGNACTVTDTCQAGVCVAGPAAVCSDGNQCTADTCNPATGACEFDAVPREGEACTLVGPSCITNSCQTGVCTQAGLTGCLINNTCYPDGALNPTNTCQVCDAASDQAAWSSVAAATSCNDGLFCTTGEVCDGGGVCGGGAARDCSSAAAECFTATACDEANDTCIPTTPEPQGTACGGDLCTRNGMCNGGGICTGMAVSCAAFDSECTVGVCSLADGSCSAVNRLDGTGCDDGVACTSGDTCTTGVCGGTVVDCSGLNSACVVGVCNTASGVCDATPANEGGTCDDADACTETDTCTAGSCAGVALVCDDGNSCSGDTCDSATGCVFTPLADGTACTDDALSCTTDACNAGVCENNLATGCLITNTCVAEGASDPNAFCRICDAAATTNDYSNAAAGTACALETCSDDGLSVLAGACDSMGTCTPAVAGAIDCAPYRCDAAACQTTCVDNADCQDGFECRSNECVEPVGEDMGNDTGDAGDMGTADVGNDTGDVGGEDMAGDAEADASSPNSELKGSGCACNSADGAPTDMSWMIAVFGFFAISRKRRR